MCVFKSLLDNKIVSVFNGLKHTNQSFAQLVISNQSFAQLVILSKSEFKFVLQREDFLLLRISWCHRQKVLCLILCL